MINEMDNKSYFVGLDMGSTTAKICVLNDSKDLCFSDYRRHNTEILNTLRDILSKMYESLGDCELKISIGGTAGMGLSEILGIPFVQEVVASCETVRQFYNDVNTLIDIGGEDSKLIFFNRGQPDIRMNGNCAGGTGAFIDQMSRILNLPVDEMDRLACNYTKLYPISSRCGVFAKTDVQNMISRHYKIEDICASIFNAVAIQTINSLARGFNIEKKVLFCGGPLTFISSLRDAFVRILGLFSEDVVIPLHPELVVATGLAVMESERMTVRLTKLIEVLNSKSTYNYNISRRLSPLFKDGDDLSRYRKEMNVVSIRTDDLSKVKEGLYLGVDSGSTTTKVVLIDKNLRVVADFYSVNNGDPINTVFKGLQKVISDIQRKTGIVPVILNAAVTGYGEELIKSALGINLGIVETMAHFKAAKMISSDVSFILDIGGQDMKAMFVENGFMTNLVINEACSSGCGSFLMSFAGSLGMDMNQFADVALSSRAPCDLGTRCTVFMGSRIKQALKEGAEISDIAAGLSYSIIKNCLYKMLRLKDPSELGDHIVVQGGTLKNLSILKALEKEIGKGVITSDAPELMGAYGAAIYSAEVKRSDQLPYNVVESMTDKIQYETDDIRCSACENRCEITRYTFRKGARYYNGNKCERIYSNRSTSDKKGFNFVDFKNRLLFGESLSVMEGRLKIGIPRILGMYENFVFYRELFLSCGFNIILSDVSTSEIYTKGLGTVMSDNICFPAKLAHGHIMNLIEKGVDRIFYPIVIYERKSMADSTNTYNCPIVASYAEVLKSSIDPQNRYGVPFDSPTINFKDLDMLKSSCFAYLSSLGVDYATFITAFEHAKVAFTKYRINVCNKARDIIEDCRHNDKALIVFVQRPYHIDPMINQNVAKIASDIGIDSITEDALEWESVSFDEIFAIPQWAFINRIIKAARWVNKQSQKTCIVQVNSFGCGPDSFVVDETKEIVNRGGHYYIMVRVDEFSNVGSIKLRLLSLKEALRSESSIKKRVFVNTAKYTEKDRERKILVPHFSDIYSPFLPSVFKNAGIDLEVLPPADYRSIEYGLKYVNNEVCYPATIVIGDIIKALSEGNYDTEKVAVALTQTGGQCRASNYVPLLKKAMVFAGFKDIPVVSIGFDGDVTNEQPGFNIEWRKIIRLAFFVGLYADALARMYYSSVAREEEKGISYKTLQRFIDASRLFIEKSNYDGLIALLKNAVAAFNRVKTIYGYLPKIGLVGEIFLKYNNFSNSNIVDWLVSQGVEVVAPLMADFFMQFFVNVRVNIKSFTEKASVKHLIAAVLEVMANEYISRFERVLMEYKFYTPTHDIFSKAYKARRIVDLVNQFGEGWLIPAEICSYAENNVNNIISIQPFGCIANHIVSKGVEKVLKRLYPNLNLLFLDFDPCISEVNLYNRLYFMVKNAKQSFAFDMRPYQGHNLREVFN